MVMSLTNIYCALSLCQWRCLVIPIFIHLLVHIFVKDYIYYYGTQLSYIVSLPKQRVKPPSFDLGSVENNNLR